MAKKKNIIDTIDNAIPTEGFIIIDNTKREILNEGRSIGMGFAPALRKENTLIQLQAISSCKDYLSDWIYTFATKKPCSYYGLKTKVIEDIYAYDEFYLLMSILNYNNKPETAKYPLFDRDLQALENNYKNCEKLLNWFETQFKLDKLSKIIKVKDNLFLCIAPLFWTDATYKISLLSLLLRNGIFYKNGDCMEFLANTKEDASDAYFIKAAIPKIKKMLDGFIPKCDFDSISHIHNEGIANTRLFS
jgi:hypothetical protein